MRQDRGALPREGVMDVEGTGPPASGQEPVAASTDGAEAAPRPPVAARSLAPATLVDRLVSALLWAVGLTWMVPALGSMTLVYLVVPSHRVNILGRIYCTVQIFLTGNRWRAVVDPAVDPGRAYIFAQNHTNHFDHVAMYNATPHFKQGLELESHFRYPFYGWFMKARGTIPVRKGQGGQTKDVMDLIRRELDAGRSILAFPEGTRTPDGRIGPLRKGIFFIARDLGVPIVPVTVTGAYDMMRKGSLLIRPGNTLTVYCDRPVEMAGRSDDEVRAAMEEVERVMVDRVEGYWAERAAS
ncbi:MAG: 1-acyl-sn-glycerol-3-phosphate acyltransferase [Sandaracinaceae bacterium]